MLIFSYWLHVHAEGDLSPRSRRALSLVFVGGFAVVVGSFAAFVGWCTGFVARCSSSTSSGSAQ